MPSYKELLKQALTAKSPSFNISTETLREQVAHSMIEIATDLNGVELTDDHLVHQLVQAKFDENSALSSGEIQVFQSNPVVEEIAELLDSTILGIYPEAAYNVWAYLYQGYLALYIEKVPPNGNPGGLLKLRRT